MEHAFPPEPHAPGVSPFWQVPLVSQQPPTQVVGPHIPQAWGVPPPAPQVLGLVHTAQAVPPLPHAPLVSPFWQSPLVSQHPLGQVVGLQTPQAYGVPPPAPQVFGLVQTTHAAPP